MLPDNGQLAAWLYRVAVRQALLYRRKLGREARRVRQYAGRTEAAETTTSTQNPLGWLLADEESELVRMALQRLAPRDRELVLLKYTEEWSCRQLAQHLGISITAIETRLYRARERLRQELARLDVKSDGQASI